MANSTDDIDFLVVNYSYFYSKFYESTIPGIYLNKKENYQIIIKNTLKYLLEISFIC